MKICWPTKCVYASLLGSWLLLALPASWAEMPAEAKVVALQQQWDHIMFEVEKKQQEAAFAQLAQQADAMIAKQSDDAGLLIWSGIVHSTYAGVRGGLGALAEVKKARALFEKAINLDGSALQGAAYTSLGSLYYQVPGWPVSFGDEEKAEELLKKGLALDSTGMDANYFYGDYLLHEKQYAQAIEYLQTAMAAPARAGRSVADAGRRKQIAEALTSAQKKASGN